MNNIIISISGLGYVGLPVAIAFGKKIIRLLDMILMKKESMSS